MKPAIHEKLTQKSKENKCFLIMENGEWYVCDKLDALPCKGKTLGIILEEKDKRIQALEKQNETMKKEIANLAKALDTLIK